MFEEGGGSTRRESRITSAGASLIEERLAHLPPAKQTELEHVVTVIRDGFARTLAFRTQPRLRQGRLLKIVLFGSYARGDWIEDPGGRYYSDYDLLVVVSDPELTDVAEFWERTERRLLDDFAAGVMLRTPVSLIYHSLDDVNEKLRLGRYFFVEILRDGIVLFEEPGHPFAAPQPLANGDALREMRSYLASWHGSAMQFYRQYEHAMADGAPKIAAFNLHQLV